MRHIIKGVLLTLAVLGAIVAISIIAGCTHTAVPAPPVGLFGKLFGTTGVLTPPYTVTTWLMVIGGLGIGAGIAAVVFVPGDDKIPWGIVIGSAAMFGFALFIQLILGILPYLFIGGIILLLLGGAIWLSNRKHRRALEEKFGLPIEKDNESTTTTKPS